MAHQYLQTQKPALLAMNLLRHRMLGVPTILFYGAWIYLAFNAASLHGMVFSRRAQMDEPLHSNDADWYTSSLQKDLSHSSASKSEKRSYEFNKVSESAPVCSPLRKEDVDFTFVTQLSLNRLWIMKEHCKRWGPHPMSVAIGDRHLQYESAARELQRMGCDMKHISLQIERNFSSRAEFPINRLRNLALSAVNTSHAIIMDADFLLSDNLYDHLMPHQSSLLDEKHALVIPAFEQKRLCDNPEEPECRDIHFRKWPKSKKHLIHELLKTDHPGGGGANITAFNLESNIHGHASTRLKDWLNQPVDQLVSIDCLTSKRYEPYLVVRYCRSLPPFQEAFEGYGKNKITWIRHLVRAGYRFSQISGGYVVHYPHRFSESKMAFQATKRNRTMLEVDQIAHSFYEWLGKAVPDKTKLSMCPLPKHKFLPCDEQGYDDIVYDCCVENWHPRHKIFCPDRPRESENISLSENTSLPSI